jgi:sugar phosphate isomerase/epimerase
MALPLLCRAQQNASPAPGTALTLGFGTYGMKALATEEAIRVVSQTGYDSIELCVVAGWDADSATLTDARRRAIRRQLGDTRLHLAALMEHLHPDSDALQTAALERLKRAAAVANDLAPHAPPLVQTTLGGGSWDQVREPLRDRLGEWVAAADAAGIVVAIKPHRGGAVSQPAHAAWLIQQLGQPARLRMVYDYSHYAFRDLSLEATVRTALPYTAHVAVKDAVRENDQVRFRLAGEAGTIDYPALLRLLYDGGYRGDVSCEVSGMVWNQPDYDPVRAARQCYDAMARAFQQAGIARRTA